MRWLAGLAAVSVAVCATHCGSALVASPRRGTDMVSVSEVGDVLLASGRGPRVPKAGTARWHRRRQPPPPATTRGRRPHRPTRTRDPAEGVDPIVQLALWAWHVCPLPLPAAHNVMCAKGRQPLWQLSLLDAADLVVAKIMSKPLHFEFFAVRPSWSHASGETKDVLRNVMCTQPRARPTRAQRMGSPHPTPFEPGRLSATRLSTLLGRFVGWGSRRRCTNSGARGAPEMGAQGSAWSRGEETDGTAFW